MHYQYMGIVTDVHDGDSVTLDLDLGIGIWVKKFKTRLSGINAPELKQPTLEAARRSRDFLRERILGKQVIVQTLKDRKEKYGRYLVRLYLEEGSLSLNEELIQHGHAVPYMTGDLQ